MQLASQSSSCAITERPKTIKQVTKTSSYKPTILAHDVSIQYFYMVHLRSCVDRACLCLTTGGQRRVGPFAQRAGECGGEAQPSRGRERAAPAEDHRGGDLQTGAAQRAGEDQRGKTKTLVWQQVTGSTTGQMLGLQVMKSQCLWKFRPKFYYHGSDPEKPQVDMDGYI